ncbi:hypothetical protein B0H14DRAFT_3499762 [Mycena olivaceomarginata]|nr:hypothetical protein B0H14DRAFT_3499762 [Mycena olivaceomarginata]
MAPSSVVSHSASAVSKTARKLKKVRSSDDKHKWTSPIYTFFRDNVETVTDSHDGRKYQAFKCNAPGRCKSKSDFFGVKRYQKKVNGDPHSDCSSTSNLKKHAKHCWGSDVVEARLKGVAADATRNGSIFAAFARSGQRPRQCQSSYPHQAGVSRASHRQLEDLLTAGWPELTVPSCSTVARDLKAVYEHSADRVKKLLAMHGPLPTIAPLSPGLFISSTRVNPWAFFWISSEVPESHTGEVLALEFDDMLRRFGLQRKILAWTGDNATSNDIQNTALDQSSENDFDAVV